jgi:hypothetical protein
MHVKLLATRQFEETM